MSETFRVRRNKIRENSKVAEWRYVNTDNEFEFMGRTFVIDESVEQYKVYNKAGEVYDYTNEAMMDRILIVVDNENRLRFYDQDLNEIDGSLIQVLG